MFGNRGIAFKLIFLVSICCALIFTSILMFGYYSSKQMIEKNVMRNSELTSLATVNRIETALGSVQKVPETISLFLETGLYDEKELLNVLRASVARNSEIYGATVAFEPYAFNRSKRDFAPYFFKKDGKVEFSSLEKEEYNYRSQDWYQISKELNKPQWSEPYFDEGGGNILMATYSVPFYKTVGGEKRLMGIVTADISLEWLRDVVSSIKILKTGYGTLLSRNGTFVTHPEKQLIMNQTIFDIAEERTDRSLRETGKRMIAGEKGFAAYKESGNAEIWMYYAPVPSSGWSLALFFPRDEMMADVARLNRIMIVIGVIGIILLSLAVVSIARSITRPLTRISEAAAEMGGGNLDVTLPSVSAHDEVGRLADAFHSMRDSLKEHIRKLTDITAAKEKIESELKIARDIQMGCLPNPYPLFTNRQEFELYTFIEPAREIGGDFYDFFYIDDRRLFFTIADVSGKGVPASLYMALTKTLIKATAKKIVSPELVLASVNDELSSDGDVKMFVTVFCGILDIASGEILYSNGGHNPPLIRKPNGNIMTLKNPGGLVIGAFEGIEYRLEKARLDPGDVLFMYTDGVTEAMNGKEEFFSVERLENDLSLTDGNNVRNIIGAIMTSIISFTEGAPQSDDITMMAIQYKGHM